MPSTSGSRLARGDLFEKLFRRRVLRKADRLRAEPRLGGGFRLRPDVRFGGLVVSDQKNDEARRPSGRGERPGLGGDLGADRAREGGTVQEICRGRGIVRH